MFPNLPHFFLEGRRWGNFVAYVEKKVRSFLPKGGFASFAWNASSFPESKIKASILLRFESAIASMGHFMDEESLIGWTSLKNKANARLQWQQTILK